MLSGSGLSISGPCYLPLDTHSPRISLYLLFSLVFSFYKITVSLYRYKDASAT